MTDSDIALRIREQWSSLTKSDRLVARCFLSAYPLAGLKTLAELASRAGVSAPSVIRCVKKLGFASYPEFQRALHDEVQEAFHRFGELDESDAKLGAPPSESESAWAGSLRRTIRMLGDAQIREFATLVARSKASVLCLGGRVSQALALVFHAHLLRLRRNVELVSANPVERAERLMDVGTNDIVVLFDYMPFDPQAHSFAKLVADCKATLACFTDFEQSPAAEFAQYVVCSDNRAVENAPSLTAAMCSAEIVLGEVRARIGTRALARSRTLADSVPDAPITFKTGLRGA